MGQDVKQQILRYHPHWRKIARFARTIMRSAGITAAAAVGYYSLRSLSFLPALVSPFTVHSTAPLPPNTRLSERFLYGYSSYSTVFGMNVL